MFGSKSKSSKTQFSLSDLENLLLRKEVSIERECSARTGVPSIYYHSKIPLGDESILMLSSGREDWRFRNMFNRYSASGFQRPKDGADHHRPRGWCDIPSLKAVYKLMERRYAAQEGTIS